MLGKGDAKNGFDASSWNLTAANNDLVQLGDNAKKHGELIASLVNHFDEKKVWPL